MTKDEFYVLLDAMALPDSIISAFDAPKWRFWRREIHLKEKEVFLLLREFIERKTSPSDIKVRENAYSVLAKLLLKTFEPEHCQFLIDRLKAESNKHVLHTMLTGISRLQLPPGVDISAIVACSKNNEWLVRHSAIVALTQSNTDASRKAVRYWVAQEDEKQYKFELIYANAALGCIGEIDDIDLLAKHTNSRIPDVKDSALFAINNIKQRFGMIPLDEK